LGTGSTGLKRTASGRAEEEAEMKVRSSVASMKKMPGSKVVRRNGRVYVVNKLNPRFKTRQG
jgi:large subunit ribosomal protein L36